MRAAVYTRVSTDEQAQHGTSLEDQWRRGRAHAEHLGASVVDRYEDGGQSGASLDRPALAALRGAIAVDAYDVVVVTDPDRLARRLVDQLLLTDEITRRATLTFVQFDWQDSADGRLFYALRGAVAEFEREKIRQRTHLGRLSAARAGRIAAVPHQAFGYAYDRSARRLRTLGSEGLVVREIFSLCTTREWGSLRIARHLNALGLTARHGGRWHAESVRRILRNPLYAGRLRQLGGHVAAPALVSDALWREAQAVLDGHRGRRPGRPRRPYLLRGMLRCAVCGAAYVAKAPGRRRRRRAYLCAGRRRGTCTARAVPASELERAVWRRVVRALRAWERERERATADSARLRPLDVERERQRVLRMVRRGLAEPTEAAAELNRLERAQSLARLGAQVETAGAAAPAAPALRLAARRRLLRLIEVEAIVAPGGLARVTARLPPAGAPRHLAMRRGGGRGGGGAARGTR